ncbi:MAG: MarR family transcriptional regulator [Deltaproteobacteria bacterium]|nr:MarR family transcriptional regulator [Deltaproteobacteria bacterium]
MDITRKIIKLIHKYNRLYSIHTRDLTKNYDLNVVQLLCLRCLYEKGEMSISGIARNNMVNMSTLTRTIDMLEEKHLLERRRVLPDRRVITIALTGKGRLLAENSPPLVHPSISEAISTLSKNEHEEIKRALETLDRLIDPPDDKDISHENNMERRRFS